jgi:anthranilate synthase component 2
MPLGALSNQEFFSRKQKQKVGRRMLLMIDNYDSFTYNLVQYLGELGVEVQVFRNDEIDLAGVAALGPERIVVSPGPCTPMEAGISVPLIRAFAGRVPILGVCLGHQSIGHAFGGQVVKARQVMHGKTSPIHHADTGVFSGLDQPFQATRYHSLVVEAATLPACLEVTAWTLTPTGERDEIMGLRHRELPVQGCNSIRNPFSPSKAMSCCVISWKIGNGGAPGLAWLPPCRGEEARPVPLSRGDR